MQSLKPQSLGEPGIPAVCPDSARAPSGYLSACLWLLYLYLLVSVRSIRHIIMAIRR